MSEENAVAVREESPQALSEELERRKSEARSLELKVSRKEGELRKAQEEQALLKELRMVSEMIIKKQQRKSEEPEPVKKPPPSMKISPESLEELMALQDQLKMEEKKSAELQDEANVISQRLEDVERTFDQKSTQLALVKRSTGYDIDSRAAKSGPAALNEYVDRKKALAALEKEKHTLQQASDRLTHDIEELTRGAEEGQQLEESIREAEEQLRKQKQACAEASEALKSHERLHKKKERMLNESTQADDYKTIRMLENDKRVLHSNLVKLRENSDANSKSILSLEVRLRQLETRLESVNLFLTQVFDEVEEEEPMEGIPEDATEVPLATFEALSAELELSRETVKQRDEQLMSHDAQIEQLERKVGVLKAAISSRAVGTQLHAREKERQTETLVSDMGYLRKRFDVEHSRLVQANAMLREKLAQA